MADIIELGRRIKAKFPGAYDDMGDEALGAKIRSKFAEYRDFTDPLPAGAEKTGLPGVPVVSPRPQEDHAWQKALPDFIRVPLGAIQAVGEGALGIATGAGDALEAATGWEQFGGLSRWWNEAQKKYQGGYRDLNAKPLETVEGTAGLVGSGVGSSLGFMLPGMGIAKGVGLIDKVSKMSAGAKLATQLGAGVAASSALETIVDAGAAYREVMEDLSAKRSTPEVARAVAWETVKREFPATALTNAAEFLLPGIGGKKARAVLGLMFEGGQEVIQGEAQRAARASQGLENADVNRTRLEEFVGGAAGGAVSGWLMGGGTQTPSGETIPVNQETMPAGDETIDADAETPAAKPYTPEQYAQAFEMTMKREKAASPTEIRKALGVDFKTATAILQQMQDEGWVKRMGPKGSKFWKIVKRPEAQPASTASSTGSVELDPLRPNVYAGESQNLEYLPEQARMDASQTAAAETIEPELTLESQPASAEETVRPERDPSANTATVDAKPPAGGITHYLGDGIEMRIDEREDGKWVVKAHDTNDGSVLPGERLFDSREEADEEVIRSLTAQGLKLREESQEPDQKVNGGKKLLIPTRAGIEIVDSETGESEGIAGEKKKAPTDTTQSLIQSLKGSIGKNESLGDIKKFMTRVERETGMSAARGEIQPKEAYDILEAAVNEIVAEEGKEAMEPGYDFGRALTGLRAMMKLLPTQSSRSETQVKFQQFSTPPTLAYMAARLAAPTKADTVLEPSAGTGGLASWAKAAGSTVVTNEIEPKRTDLLKRQGYQVTSEDAEQIHNILPDSVKPTVVLMNPPFSAAGIRGTKNTNNVGYRHVDQAFARLQAGGRLVVILGEGATLDAATAQPFWKAMAAKGNIRANIGVDGKEYAKYGTTFGNRVIVIDKTGPTPGANWLKQRAGIVKGDFKSIEEAWDAVSSIAADRSRSDSAVPVGKAGEGAGSLRTDPAKPESSTGGQPTSGEKRGPRPDRRGSAGKQPASGVVSDTANAGDSSASGKPAGVSAGAAVDTKPSGQLQPATDDAAPPVRPVRKSFSTGDRVQWTEGGKTLRGTVEALRKGGSGGSFDGYLLVLPDGASQRITVHKDLVEKETLTAAKPPLGDLVIEPLLGGEKEVVIPAAKPVEPTAAEIDAKHGELLADAAAAARERIRNLAKGNQLNAGLDPQTLLDLATIAAEFMHAKGIAFKKWSEPFVQEMGEWVREHLQAIRDRAEEVYDELRAKALQALSRPERRQNSSSEEDARKEEPKTETSGKSPESPREPTLSTPSTATAESGESSQAKPTAREDDGGNVVYVPTKLPKSWGAQPHPGRIVETQSMAATEEPDIVMKPNIPWELVRSGAVSEVQINAVALAVQSHERFSADGTRQGFFIGDGTGVGKGITTVATILHHWNSGVKRIIYVSFKDDLIEDTKRYLADLNASIPIQSIKKFKKGQAIEPKFKEGIVFVAYTTLAQSAAPTVQNKDGSKGKESKAQDFYRVQQLAEWAGEESMIVFDEAHEAKNAVVAEGGGARKGKASAAGQAVTLIQDQLKKARVLYASATGFTDPTNIGYAKRLGLWGEGTAFPHFTAFNSAISRGGVGAMEMVARDMKAQGKYVSRFLSYAGVEFRETIHQLTEAQQEVFESAGEAWRLVFKDILTAMQVTQATSSWAAKGAESQFWAANQRFYRTLLTAMKVPTLFRVVDDALAADRSVVISVLGTGAAATDRALSKMLSEEDGGSLDDLDVSPADILIQFVERSYPIYQYQEVADEDGRVTSQLVRDSEGNPVINKEALEAKNRLLKRLEGMQMPEAALDQIVNRYGPANVAELTGRAQRIIEGEDGKKVLEKRKAEGSGNSVNVEEARQFQDGKKRIAIISNAASTGISLHADRRAKNQQRRQHIILELKWSADDQMQDFGRTHRTNESSQPIYELLSVNVGADKRFSSSIARRLEQLGALSRGDRASSGAGDIAKYNFETIYGKAAIKAVVDAMNRNEAETLQMMGLATEQAEAKADQIPVTQFLNRLMSLPLERQNRTFDRFMDAFAEAIDNAKKNGMFDAGAEKILADRLEMAAEPTVIRTDETTGARTVHYEINALQKRDRYTWEEATEAVRKDHRLMRQKTSGRLVAVAREPYNTKTAVDGTIVGVHRYLAASGGGAMEATDFDKFEAVPADKTARATWDEQFQAAGPHRVEHVHLIGGSVLPIYDRLGDGNKPLKVEIAAMPDGQRILGVRIQHTRIKQVLRSLGHGVSVTPTDILAGVLGGETYELAGGLKLKKLVRAGQDRIEVATPSNLVQRVWNLIQPHGGFNENIQYVFRYFLPNDERALGGVQALLKEFPVVADSSGKVEMAESKANLSTVDGGNWINPFSEGVDLSSLRTHDDVNAQTQRQLLDTAKETVYLPLGDRPAVVGLNRASMLILAAAIGGGVKSFGGFHLDASAAAAMLHNLDVLAFRFAAKGLPVASFGRLKRVLTFALQRNGGLGVVAVWNDQTRKSRDIAADLREELTHFEQAALPSVDWFDMGETAEFERHARARLAAAGYSGLSGEGEVRELSAKLAAGQWKALGIDESRAKEFVRRYVLALQKRTASDASSVLRWAKKEIRDGSKTEGRLGPAANSGSLYDGGRAYIVLSRTDGESIRGGGDSVDARQPGRVDLSLSAGRGQSVRPGVGKTPPRTFREVLEKSEVRRLREKQKRTDTPDAEYRRILQAVSGQTGTKQLTKAQAQEVFDRLQTATVPVAAMLRSPSRILSRSRFGERIYQAAEENWFLQERLNERWGKNWAKANKGTTKAERNRIALYRFASQIAQMRGEDSAREWLDSIGEDSSIMDDLEGFLTPKEKAVNAKWTTLFFEPSRKMGIAEGLIDGKQQFDNYLSFYHDSTLRLNRKKIRDAAAELAREIGVPVHIAEQILEKANPKKVSFGSFDFTRQEWSIPGLRDADMIAEIYRKGFARKVAISRFLAEANPLTKKIVDPALRTYARRYIAQYAGKPQVSQVMTDAAWNALMSRIPILRSIKPSAGEVAGWFTALQYNAKIGFNLFTPLLNLTQTVLNTMPYAGTRRTVSVLPRAMAAVALPMKLNPFVRDIARLRRGGVFNDDPSQGKFDRPVFHGVAEHVQKAASFLFDKAESLNRATAYLAGLDLAASEGLKGENAVRRAREVVRVTQFYSGRLDAPLFSRTPIGKLVMQFKTFTVKQLEFIGQLNRRQQAEFALWTVALGGPASVLLLQAFRKFFPDWEVTEWLEQWNESWNVAASLQAERLKYQMGVFTVPGVEFLGSGRLSERMAKWMAGPTFTTIYDLADSSAATLNDPGKFDKWAESVVRGMVPGGVEWLRAKKAMEEAETPEEAVRILTGTEGR